VPKGWTAPAAGYYLSNSAMRDTVSGWTTARKEADIRQQALEALRDEVKAQQADLKRQLAELQHEIAAERRLWRGRVRRGKTQGLIYGVLAGFAGGYLVRRNNP
jgi:C4-dicarboxylate-specific signal transduction histidine kinase